MLEGAHPKEATFPTKLDWKFIYAGFAREYRWYTDD